jgi:hypothetical protein
MLKGGLPKKYQRNIAASQRRTAANRQACGRTSTSGRRDRGAVQSKVPNVLLGENDVEELAEGLLKGQGAVSLPVRGAGGPLAAARQSLLLSNAPSELPCRDKEKARVTKFVENIIDKGDDWTGSWCLYAIIPCLPKPKAQSQYAMRILLATKSLDS